MPQSLAFTEVIRNPEDIRFWNIDSLINSHSFRCMRTKFQLYHYDQLFLILTQLDRYFLDIIYTDSDFFLATWDSDRSFLPVEKNAVCERLILVKHNSTVGEGSKHVLLGKVSCENKNLEEGNEKLEKQNGILETSSAFCTVILIGGTKCKVLILFAEMKLSAAVVRNWLNLQFTFLPNKMCERLVVMEEFLLQYDRLASIMNDKSEQDIRENVLETVQKVTGTAAENTATIGIETTATSLGHAAAGVVLAVFVDIAVTASMLARAKVRKDQGKITEQQYKREIRDRLFQTGCQFVAGTTGTIVGQIVVPVPVVGAAIGGFVGSLVGLGVSMGVAKIHKVVERAKKRKEMMMIEN